MALNPFRDALGAAGRTAFQNTSSYKAETDAALARFQAYRNDLERQVRRGDLTVKVARAQAAAAAAELREALQQGAEGHSPVPRVFLDRLIEAGNARAKARESLSLEGLQRETLKLLRQGLIEQQLQSRAAEFEGRSFVRPLTGGPAVPTLDGLLAFHESAGHAGDESAREWARRQLEGFRVRTTDPEAHRRIDLACDRPDTINPRLVARYVEAMQTQDPDGLETFVTQAIETRDANACAAAFVLARATPEGTRPRWVRMVLTGLGDFPDTALATLRTVEAEARAADSEAAKAQAEFAAAAAEAQVRLPGLEPPSEAELARQARLQAKPAAQLGEPIGLALNRRGASPEEFTALHEPDPETQAN